MVIIICIATSSDRKSKLNRLFMRIVVCSMAALVFDAVSWCFDGKSFLAAYYIVRAAKLLAYSSSYLLVPLLTDYIVGLISRNAKISRILARSMYALCGIAILLVVVSQFNGMYYDFDENNSYRVQDLFWLSQVLGILYLVIDTAAILRYRKSISKSELLFLLSYAIFPLIAMFLQMFILQEFEFLFVATMLSVVASYGGIQAQQSKLLKEKELELSESRVSVMLSQIQPHFLYNSLVMIKQLCRINPEMAEETVMEFSEYLRGNLNSLSIKTLIPFEHELKHVEIYLSIEKKRFGDKVNINYDINSRDFYLPALTLQPIVENAVRYGITMKEEGGSVMVRTEETESETVISVIDDGVGFDQCKPKLDGRSHIGIENVRNRLAAMCGGTLEVYSRPEGGTTAIIRIPKEEETAV